MDALVVGAVSACWLGILTSISPCPLATNIAAISYIGKRVDKPRQVLLSGLLYMAGRVLVYVALGILIVSSVLSIPELSNILQRNMNVVLGPVLILVGVLLLGLIPLRFSGFGLGDAIQRHADSCGIWGAALMGGAFALSFCPVSAALFFGSLIPLSVTHDSRIIFPSLYGIGTGVPVILFALLIAVGARFVGSVFNKLAQFEVWARRITGVIFILVGVYYSMIYIFNMAI